jgi:hypothetical protein
VKLNKLSKKRARNWLIVLLPVLCVFLAGFLPLKPFVNQALIGIVFIWFQVTIMLGFFG